VKCTVCHQDKPRADFYRNRSRKDGLQSSCKRCTNSRRAAIAARIGYMPIRRYKPSCVEEEYYGPVVDYLGRPKKTVEERFREMLTKATFAL